MQKLKELWNIVQKLRGPKGCPWDKEQDEKTLLPYLLEETSEIAAAVEKNNTQSLKEELGDLLFMIFSYISIAEEKNIFKLDAVLESINQKMIRRHPHVFSNKKLQTSQEVIQHWHNIKEQERKNKNTSILDNVPENISALLRAQLIQERAARVGFDWKKPQEAFLKVKEEIQELEEHLIKNAASKNIKEEIGDLMFAIINVSRLLKINPESALKACIEKFSTRFRYIETKIKQQNKSIHAVSLNEMESLWQESKDKV